MNAKLSEPNTASNKTKQLMRLIVTNNSLIMLIVMILISAYVSDAFLSKNNIFNLLRQLAPLMIMSIGMLLVINTGGIDLSVGSLMGAGGLLVTLLMPYMPGDNVFTILAGSILVIIFGAFLGAFSGFLVAYMSIAAFITTLAMMTIARGITYMMSNGQPIRLPYDKEITNIFDLFGSGSIPVIGIPWPVGLAIIVIILFYFIMHYTSFGRMVIATGSNETALRLAGIRYRYFKFMVYAISGALSALAGIVATSRTLVGTPITGIGFELDAIAACVIGGALLSGGKGTVINTVIGVLVLGLIGNVMNLLSIPAYPQQIIKGLIIILAVLLQRFSDGNRS